MSVKSGVFLCFFVRFYGFENFFGFFSKKVLTNQENFDIMVERSTEG